MPTNQLCVAPAANTGPTTTVATRAPQSHTRCRATSNIPRTCARAHAWPYHRRQCRDSGCRGIDRLAPL